MLKQNGGDERSTIVLPRRANATTLVGSGDECDIVIKSPGLRSKHAVIEYYPKTNSFWLRQLDPKIEQKRRMDRVPPPPPYPYEDRVLSQNLSDNTRQEVLRDGSLIELQPMDTLRFGKGINAVEFVFKMPPMHHKTGFDSFGTHPIRKKCSLDRGDISLPVIGTRIHPKAHADRFVRPKQQSNHRLCQLPLHKQSIGRHPQQSPNGVALLRRSVSACRLISVADSPTNAQPRVDTPSPPGRTEEQQTNGGRSQKGYANSSSVSSVDSDGVAARRIAPGHKEQQLLRRVQRLQAELSRRDAELARLRQMVAATNEPAGGRRAAGDNASTVEGQQAVDAMDVQKKQLMGMQMASSSAEAECSQSWALPGPSPGIAGRISPAAEQSARAQAMLTISARASDIFFAVCAEELNALNTRVAHFPARDYSDIFNEINKLLHEPFSFRLMEINSKCAAVFESLDLLPVEKEQLYVQFDQFLKEKIYPISKSIDAFLSTLRECAQMARDSARACAIFSQWSREFGDQLQLQPNWELMFYKVQDLQSRFRENGLSKHWLPPSLSPLLQVLIFEHRNRTEEQKSQQREASDALAEAKRKIGELERELENAANGTKLADGTPTKAQTKQQLPRIELPSLSERRQSSLRSQRSSRASSRDSSARRQLRLGPGITDDEDADNSSYEAPPIDSPQTPPPSVGGAGQRNIAAQRSGRKRRSARNDGEEEEKPWGDKMTEGDDGTGKSVLLMEPSEEEAEQEEEEEEEEKEEEKKEEEEEEIGTNGGHLNAFSSSDEDGEEKVRLTMYHLNSVYAKLEEQRNEKNRGEEEIKEEEKEREEGKEEEKGEKEIENEEERQQGEEEETEEKRVEGEKEVGSEKKEEEKWEEKEGKWGKEENDTEEEQFEWIERMVKESTKNKEEEAHNTEKIANMKEEAHPEEKWETHPEEEENSDGTHPEEEAKNDGTHPEEEAKSDGAHPEEKWETHPEEEAKSDGTHPEEKWETRSEEQVIKDGIDEQDEDEAVTKHQEEKVYDEQPNKNLEDEKEHPEKKEEHPEENKEEEHPEEKQHHPEEEEEHPEEKKEEEHPKEEKDEHLEEEEEEEKRPKEEKEEEYTEAEKIKHPEENKEEEHPEEKQHHPEEEEEHPEEDVFKEEEHPNEAARKHEEEQPREDKKDVDDEETMREQIHPEEQPVERRDQEEQLCAGEGKQEDGAAQTKDEPEGEMMTMMEKKKKSGVEGHPDEEMIEEEDEEQQAEKAVEKAVEEAHPPEDGLSGNGTPAEEAEQVQDNSGGRVDRNAEDAAARVLQKQWRKRMGGRDGGAVAERAGDEPEEGNERARDDESVAERAGDEPEEGNETARYGGAVAEEAEDEPEEGNETATDGGAVAEAAEDEPEEGNETATDGGAVAEAAEDEPEEGNETATDGGAVAEEAEDEPEEGNETATDGGAVAEAAEDKPEEGNETATDGGAVAEEAEDEPEEGNETATDGGAVAEEAEDEPEEGNETATDGGALTEQLEDGRKEAATDGGAVTERAGDEPEERNGGAEQEAKEQAQSQQTNIVEFWELVRHLADLLDIELPRQSRAKARPESADERMARQKAMDSILGRLRAMLDELRRRGGEKVKESAGI